MSMPGRNYYADTTTYNVGGGTGNQLPIDTTVIELYKHSFSDTPSTHPYLTVPNVINANLINSAWTNSRSSWTSYSSNTVMGRTIAMDNSLADTANILLSLDIAPGKKAGIKSFSFYHRVSNSGYRKWKMYINGIEVGDSTLYYPATGGTGNNTVQSTGTRLVSNRVENLTGHLSVLIKLYDHDEAYPNGNAQGNFRMDDFVLNGYLNDEEAGSGSQNQYVNKGAYRYGFNGQEKSDEISGEGNVYNFDARMYNPRIGRWFSADAKGKAFSSPYNYVQNNPINRVDPDGNDDIYFVFLYDKTIPSLSHLTKFSVIVRNNEPNRYIHRTYFLTSGKGGITDQVLSDPRDKEFYPANWSSSSGLTSTKVFGFLNADDKDFVTLGKYLDEFPDVKAEANYQEIRSTGTAPSRRAKNASFLASALRNNEKRKQDTENEAAGMSLVKGVVGWVAGELVLAEIIDAVVVSKIVNRANNAVKGLKYENIGTATYKQTIGCG